MPLLGTEHIINFPHSGFKSGVKNISPPGFFPVRVCEPDYKTKGIDFEFPFPYPGRHVRLIRRIPVPIIGGFIKCIGIRVNVNILNMTLDQSGNNPLQIRVFFR
ncbi:hypothetical protein D3C73_995500 [compost metagenome]